MAALTVDQALQFALTHHKAGRLAEAEALYRQILGVQLQHPGALEIAAAPARPPGPAGPKGDPGGLQGPQGDPGPQGATGEVSGAQVDSAISTPVATTAQNPNAIAPFSGTLSDLPTQAEMQAFAAYIETRRGRW